MGITAYSIPAGLGAPLTPADVALQSGVGSAGSSLLAARADHAHRLLDTGWLTPTYQNSWVDYQTPWGPARYRKVGNVVLMKGLVKNGTLSQPIFTLPAGYRPVAGQTLLFMCQSADTYCRVEVWDDGRVIPTTGASASWVSLANIVFVADA